MQDVFEEIAELQKKYEKAQTDSEKKFIEALTKLIVDRTLNQK